ncbi:hypothetical protein GGS21DRAFT_494634 [Xylaria nigripes]|nr:hypothetical protein GGS21DRAFT_494634 [Xylaria nigripes]
MAPFQFYRNLSPKARIGVGLGLLAWGAIGIQLSDRAEERYFQPTEEDRAALRQMAPRITMVERDGDTKLQSAITTTSTSAAAAAATSGNKNGSSPS